MAMNKLSDHDREMIVRMYNQGLSCRYITDYLNSEFKRKHLLDSNGNPLNISIQAVCNVVNKRQDAVGRQAIKQRYNTETIAQLYKSGLTEEDIVVKLNKEFELDDIRKSNGQPFSIDVNTVHDKLLLYKKNVDISFEFRRDGKNTIRDLVDIQTVVDLHNKGKNPQEIARILEQDLKNRGINRRVRNNTVINTLMYYEKMHPDFDFSKTRRDKMYEELTPEFMYSLYVQQLTFSEMREKCIELLKNKGYNLDHKSVTLGMIQNKLNKALEKYGDTRLSMNKVHEYYSEITPEYVGSLYEQGYSLSEIIEYFNVLFAQKGYKNTTGKPLVVSRTTILKRRKEYIESIGMNTKSFQYLCNKKRLERKYV